MNDFDNTEPASLPPPPWAADVDEDADTFDFGDEETKPGGSEADIVPSE